MKALISATISLAIYFEFHYKGKFSATQATKALSDTFKHFGVKLDAKEVFQGLTIHSEGNVNGLNATFTNNISKDVRDAIFASKAFKYNMVLDTINRVASIDMAKDANIDELKEKDLSKALSSYGVDTDDIDAIEDNKGMALYLKAIKAK